MEHVSRDSDFNTRRNESKRFNRIYEINRSIKEYVPFMPSVASKGWQLPVFPGLILPLFATAACLLSLKSNNPMKVQTLAAVIGSVGVFAIFNSTAKRFTNKGAHWIKDQAIEISGKKDEYEQNQSKVDEIVNLGTLNIIDNFITWMPLIIGRYFNWDIYSRKAITDPFKPYIRYAFNFIIPERYKHLIDVFSEIALGDILRHITNMTINQITYANNCAINGGNANKISDNICNGIQIDQTQVMPGITHKKTLWQLTAGIVAFTALSPLKYAVKTRLGCTDQSAIISPIINVISRTLAEFIINAGTVPPQIEMVNGVIMGSILGGIAGYQINSNPRGL